MIEVNTLDIGFALTVAFILSIVIWPVAATIAVLIADAIEDLDRWIRQQRAARRARRSVETEQAEVEQ